MESIQVDADEDITLFSDEEQVTVKTVNTEFAQASKLKGLRYEFTLFNDIQCYQRIVRKHGGKVRFRVNLTFLNAKPVRRLELAETGLVTSAILAIISFLLIYSGWFSGNSQPSTVLSVITILALTAFVITLLLALFKTNNYIIMQSRAGKIPILKLMNNKPSRQEFNEFMQTLSQHIISAQHNSDFSDTDLLTQELKQLRRLKDEGIIEESGYEKAKQRIFRNQAFK